METLFPVIFSEGLQTRKHKTGFTYKELFPGGLVTVSGVSIARKNQQNIKTNAEPGHLTCFSWIT